MAEAPSTGREAIRSAQLGRVRELLQSVRPANAFYEAKLSAVGVDAVALSSELVVQIERSELAPSLGLVADEVPCPDVVDPEPAVD